MTDYVVYFNGEWMPLSQVRIDPSDRGFTLGDAVYDAARTFNGIPFKLVEHINRLFRSLDAVSINPGHSIDSMIYLVEESIDKNKYLLADAGDFRIWIYVSRGPGRWARSAGPPTVFIRIGPVEFNLFAHFYDKGAHGVFSEIRSYPIESLDPRIKHISRMNFNLAEMEVAGREPDGWPIHTDMSGELTEGTNFNVFIVTDDVIRTPAIKGLLGGISRETVFELAEPIGVSIKEDVIYPDDIYNADEVFFTGTSFCVLPVTKIDETKIASGAPGQITRKLLSTWSELVKVDIIKQALAFSQS